MRFFKKRKPSSLSTPTSLHPIVIIEDRYGGTYSGGLWVAVASAETQYEGTTRLQFAMEDGVGGDDASAMEFWEHTKPNWAAAGNTPSAAIENLILQQKPAKEDEYEIVFPVLQEKHLINPIEMFLEGESLWKKENPQRRKDREMRENNELEAFALASEAIAKGYKQAAMIMDAAGIDITCQMYIEASYERAEEARHFRSQKTNNWSKFGYHIVLQKPADDSP